MKLIRSSLLAALAAAVATTGAVAAPAKPAAPAAASPLASLNVDIPYTKYVLKNGLTLLVHEDHKAPVVAVNIWYHVGSKNEPAGRSGFAHLFEHLMFNGSEHFDQDFFKATVELGVTNQNGTTNNDRTNYFQNVPTGALDSVLWLEADRMGWLNPAISQAKLDEQRGVVQNEKRQGENQPYAIADELITRAMYPKGHPYDHTVIGSMADLDAAKLDDVKEWFRTYYGPSNAVIVLAGDITPAEAKAKVEKYFGDIPPGPPVAHPKAWPNKLSGDIREQAFDRVPQARLYKVWNTPQDGTADADYLQLFANVLSFDKTSRLYERLVYREQLATSVQVFSGGGEIGGQFVVVANAKPGGDLTRIEEIVDEEIARLVAQGPTQAEMEKIRAARIAAFVRGLERVGGFGGKSDQLARSQTFLGSPDAWKVGFNRLKTATPAQVQGAGKRWLDGGSYTLEILPFPNYAAQPSQVERAKMPAATPTKAPPFPTLQRATLSNGMKVVLAERHDTPQVLIDMVVGGGYAADTPAKAGVASLAYNMLDEGTRTRDALQISSQLAGLGAAITTGPSSDFGSVSLSALKPTLDPALAIYADVILNPAFAQKDLDRLKRQQIAGIAQAKADPSSLASRLAPALIYGPQHPYGVVSSGTEASVAGLTTGDLAAYHQAWFKPNNATLVIVGDTTLAEITPKLERAFAGWRPGAVPSLSIAQVAPPQKPVVYLVDKPGALQSEIRVGVVAPPRSSPDQIAFEQLNSAFGGGFVSRINLNLREDKHWSYGARTGIRPTAGQRIFLVSAPVQTDKTKESLVEIRKEINDVLGPRPLTAAELATAQNNLTLTMPGRWETAGAVQGSIGEIVQYGLPDDYWATYADRVRGTTLQQVVGVTPRLISKDNLTWVIVGDRARIEQGVRDLNLGEVRIIDADGNPVR